MAQTQYYLNNSNLKAKNVLISFTQDQIVEYVKCKNDPAYFIKNYCKIVSLDHGLVNFDMYDYQERFINEIHKNTRVISMQPRQSGKTQTVAAYILHYVLFEESKTVAILANKATAAREIMSRFQLMYEYLPNWLQQGIVTWNKGDIELENGSKVFTAATATSGIRGKSVNFLYVDEAAIIPNTVADEFFTSTYPTISAGKTTKIVLTSTPLGYNHWWKFWNESVEGRNGFIPVEIKYNEHPDRDAEWAKKQRELLGELKYKQEVECSFLGSALTLIAPDAIARLSYKSPIFSNEGLDVYEEPIYAEVVDGKIVKPGGTYVITVDTAKGVGGDASSFSVIDISQVPYKLVAKYRNTEISPMLYPSVIHKVARDYNNAYVMIEVNVSEQVAYILYSEIEYDNMIFITRTPKGQFASAGFAGAGKTSLGVSMDKKVKRIGCFNFKSLIEENKLLIFDADTISEISTFIESKGSYAADEGYHDDLVMPLVMFGWLTTNPYFKELTNVNLRTELYQQRITKIEEEMTPFGFIETGIEEEIVVEDGDAWRVFDKPGYLSSNF